MEQEIVLSAGVVALELDLKFERSATGNLLVHGTNSEEKMGSC